MNNQELNSRLKSSPVPEPSQAARQQAWEQARDSFLVSRPQIHIEEVPFWKRPLFNFAFGSAFSAALMVFVWFTFLRTSEVTSLRESEVAQVQDIQMLSKVQGMFPKRLQAVVSKDNGDYELVLAKEDRSVSAQPIVLEITHDGAKSRIITFSGETIPIPGRSGKIEHAEVYLDGAGQVFLVGPDFIWHSGSEMPQGMKIRAQSIPRPAVETEEGDRI